MNSTQWSTALWVGLFVASAIGCASSEKDPIPSQEPLPTEPAPAPTPAPTQPAPAPTAAPQPTPAPAPAPALTVPPLSVQVCSSDEDCPTLKCFFYPDEYGFPLPEGYCTAPVDD